MEYNKGKSNMNSQDQDSDIPQTYASEEFASFMAENIDVQNEIEKTNE